MNKQQKIQEIIDLQVSNLKVGKIYQLKSSKIRGAVVLILRNDGREIWYIEATELNVMDKEIHSDKHYDETFEIVKKQIPSFRDVPGLFDVNLSFKLKTIRPDMKIL